MDNRDQKIKEILQNDKLISKKADDVFNNFLKEEKIMNEENLKNKNQDTKIKKFSLLKKGLATAACVAIVAGGANIYASTHGYGNVFFMIKYFVTGEKQEVTDKNAILSDRDITISYEPIQLTENIKMQVRKLQIIDNKARLILALHENELEENNEVVPLKYKVTGQNTNLLCEKTSSREERNIEYIDELELSNFTESDKILNLEISKNNGEKITKLIINIENKTITVEGEEEAINKISEIELKEFLGLVSTYPELDGTNEDSKIFLAINANPSGESNGTASIGAEPIFAIELNRVNEILKEIGYSPIPNDFIEGHTFHKITANGKEYYQFNFAGDQTFGNTCINISSISYSGGIYKAVFTYTNSINEENEFSIKEEEINVFEGTVYFKVNENNKYSKYTIVRFENMNIINNAEEYEENNNLIESSEDTVDGDHINPWQNVQPSTVPGKDNQNEKATNDISTLSWLEYWSPGLKVQYPNTFSVTTYSDMYLGSEVNYADEKTVEIEGDLKGIDENTQQEITSHLKITVYMPELIEEKMLSGIYFENAYKTIFKEDIDRENAISEGPASIFNGESNFSICRHKDGKSYGLYTRLISYESFDGGWGYKIVFESDNMENPKVKNAIYWILDNLKTTSF